METNLVKGWSHKKLGDVLKIGSGKDHKHLEEGNIPVFGTGGLMRSVDTALHEGETVFIGRKGTINKPFYYNGKFWTVDTLFYTYDFKDTTAKYINYVFQKINWLAYNEASGVPSLSKTTIEKIPFDFPPVAEQKRIIAVLETWDQAIENLKRKIEIKKEVKKGLMQELLTGKIQLLGFVEKWEVLPLRKIAQINPKADSLPDRFIYIDLESVTKGKLQNERQIELSGAPSRAQRLLKKGDVIFQTVRPYQMNNLYFNKAGNYVASTGYAQLRSYGDSEFLYHVLHTGRFVSDVLSRCTGSNYPAINSTDLGEIEIRIPKNVDEQTAIAKILTTADKEIRIFEHKLKISQDQKKYLLSNLVTGKIRTPETLILKK